MGGCEARERPPGITRSRNGSSASGSRFAAAAREVQVAVTEIFCILGVPAYHSSVIMDGREYYFDAEGITSAPPFWSHGGPRNLDECAEASPSSGQCFAMCKTQCLAAPPNLRTQVVKMGKTCEASSDLVRALSPFFEPGSYDVMHKNCNAFSDVALSFLTRRRLDPQYTRMERMLLAAEPLSTGVLNQLFRAVRDDSLVPSGDDRKTSCEECGGCNDDDLTEYVGNPAAQGFSSDAVIGLLLNGDALLEETRPDDGTCPYSVAAYGSAWACGSSACGSAQNCCKR